MENFPVYVTRDAEADGAMAYMVNSYLALFTFAVVFLNLLVWGLIGLGYATAIIVGHVT